VNAGTRHNLNVLGVIAYTPEWARPVDTFFTHPPVDAADYGQFAAAVAGRYADRVSDWELWNEPNLPPFFGYLIDNNPARYTQLVTAAYPQSRPSNRTAPWCWLGSAPSRRILAAGLPRADVHRGRRRLLRCAAAHPYVSPTGIAADPVNGWSDVGRMHDVMVTHGDGDKKIWLTELGAATSDSPEGVSQPSRPDKSPMCWRSCSHRLQRTSLHLQHPR